MTSQGSGPEYEMLKALEAQTKAALCQGDIASATRYATELLTKNTDRDSWNFGNVVHEANQLLGLSALRSGDTEAAKVYLLEAGKTPGSPQLNSFGPTMTLAQALLKQGEIKTVLDYLDLVARFWASFEPTGNMLHDALGKVVISRNARRMMKWKSAIQSGLVPVLNRIAQEQ